MHQWIRGRRPCHSWRRRQTKHLGAHNGVMYASVSYFMGRRLHAGVSFLISSILIHVCWRGTAGCCKFRSVCGMGFQLPGALFAKPQPACLRLLRSCPELAVATISNRLLRWHTLKESQIPAGDLHLQHFEKIGGGKPLLLLSCEPAE